MQDIQKMMAQVQQMKADMERTQQETEVRFGANGVEAVARGDMSIVSVRISEDIAQSGDREMLEDLVLVAVNGALDKVRKKLESQVAGLAGGMDLSSLFG